MQHTFEQELTTEQEIQRSDLYQAFQPGDLLFGLNTHRTIYADVLREKPELKSYEYLTADDFNNRIIPKVSISNRQGKVMLNFSKDSSEQNSKLDQHLAYMANPGKFIQTKDLTKYSLFNLNASNKYAELAPYIRACKLAMYKPGTTIHFCLDGIDIQAAFNQDKSDTNYYKFTSAELRFVRKNWQTLKDKVVFYQGGERQALAPWETSITTAQVAQLNPNMSPPRGVRVQSPPSAPRREREHRGLARFELGGISKQTKTQSPGKIPGVATLFSARTLPNPLSAKLGESSSDHPNQASLYFNNRS